MLTKEILFGMNLPTLAGFVVMAAGLNLSRRGRSRAAVAIALMGAGTALVFLGLYLGVSAVPPS